MKDDPVSVTVKAVIVWWLSSTDNFLLGLVFMALAWLIWYAYRTRKKAKRAMKAKAKPGRASQKVDGISESELMEAVKYIRSKREKKRGWLR